MYFRGSAKRKTVASFVGFACIFPKNAWVGGSGKFGQFHATTPYPMPPSLGCTPKGSEKVLGRVLGKGFQKGSEKGACYAVYSKQRVLRRVLRRGSEKGVSRRCLERPPWRVPPSGVCPILENI